MGAWESPGARLDRDNADQVDIERWMAGLDETQKQIVAKIYTHVKAAMRAQDAATYHGESDRGMELVANKTVKFIVELMWSE